MNVTRLVRPWCGPSSSARVYNTWFRKMGASGSRQDLLASQEASVIQQTVQNNCVVVFSKTTCSYCSMAKRVFDEIGVPYTAVELNRRQDGSKMQDVLHAMTGVSTVRHTSLYTSSISHMCLLWQTLFCKLI